MNTLREKFVTGFNVLGTLDKLPTTGNTGDVCVVGGEIYVYGLEWHKTEISAYKEIEVEFENTIKIKDETIYLT